jgi:hypothetical protein
VKQPRKVLRIERNGLIAARAREAAYRRALEHAGYAPGSVQMAIERDRDWIRKGV